LIFIKKDKNILEDYFYCCKGVDFFKTTDIIRNMSNFKIEDDNERNVEKFSAIFKALSNPNRLKILLELSNCSVTGGFLSTTIDQVKNCQQDFAKHMGLAPSTISHHFKELRQAGLIRIKREGKSVIVSVDNDVLESIKKLF